MTNVIKYIYNSINNPNRHVAHLFLLLTSLSWGITFILMKKGMDNFPFFPFLFFRFGLAALVFLPLLIKNYKQISKTTLIKSSLIGIWLFIGFFFQVWGLQYTSASASGFITGLFVVITPIVAYFYLKSKIDAGSIIGVVLATIGLVLLTYKGNWNINIGDFLTFICAIAFAVHINMIAKHSPDINSELLTFIQLSVVAILSGIMTLITSSIPDHFPSETIEAIVITALFSTVFAIWAQTKMQKYTTPTKTGIIFTMEPLFAAFFAYIIGGEVILLSGYIGGILIVSGMLLSELYNVKKSSFLKKQNKID